MKFTGERYVPNVEGEIEMEHLHRYYFSRKICEAKNVLDIASGEGYGSFIISQVAKKVIGVDISEEAIIHSRKSYASPNLEFIVGSCDSIPLMDASIDVVISFETIEHHVKHSEMMLEIKRVLRPDGIVIMSSPDKQNYSIEPNFKNIFHVRELFESEFKDLVGKFFSNTIYYGQKSLSCSAIFPEKSKLNCESYFQSEEQVGCVEGIYKPMYWIVCASNSTLPELSAGIYESKYQMFREVELRDAKINDLKKQLLFKTQEAENLSMALDKRKLSFWLRSSMQFIRNILKM